MVSSITVCFSLFGRIAISNSNVTLNKASLLEIKKNIQVPSDCKQFIAKKALKDILIFA